MKKYTLEQLKTERVKIRVETEEIYTTLMQKFDKHNIVWVGGQRATDYNVFCPNRTLINLYDAEGKLTYGCSAEFYTIITPDQIDWCEDKQDMIYPVICGSELNKNPLVFAKAQKDWNAFKSFVKEIEAHGRGLNSSQLKAFMANVRKDMKGGK